MCKIYTGYHGTSEIEHGFSACTADNPLAKASGLPVSLCTGTQIMRFKVDFEELGLKHPDIGLLTDF